jgi:hypothetical protein
VTLSLKVAPYPRYSKREARSSVERADCWPQDRLPPAYLQIKPFLPVFYPFGDLVGSRSMGSAMVFESRISISGHTAARRKWLWKRVFAGHSQTMSQSGIVGATGNRKFKTASHGRRFGDGKRRGFDQGAESPARPAGTTDCRATPSRL